MNILKSIFYFFEGLFANGLMLTGMSGFTASLVGGVITIAVAFILVCGSVFFIFSQIGSCRTNRKLEHFGANANQAADNSNIIEGNINVQQKGLENTNVERENVNEKVNNSLANVNSVRNSNERNVNGAELHKRLCSIYPTECNR